MNNVDLIIAILIISAIFVTFVSILIVSWMIYRFIIERDLMGTIFFLLLDIVLLFILYAEYIFIKPMLNG